MEDPERTYVEAGVRLAPGVRLYPGVHLEGDVEVEEGAVLGPDVHIRDSRDRGRRQGLVLRCAGGRDRPGGPGRSLRLPPTRHPDRSGRQSRYFRGDQEHPAGEGRQGSSSLLSGRCRCGGGGERRGGTITANYDGYQKHRTTIGPGAQIGSNTVLVAPVEVGEEGWIGAGSTITRPVESGALAVERSQQRNIRGYAERRAARYREGDGKDRPPSASTEPPGDS